MAHVDTKNLKPVQWTSSHSLKYISVGLIAIGVGTFAFGFFKDPERIWQAYLTSLFYFVSLGLGGLFFTSLQHVTNAGWSATVRRFSESFATFIPIGFILTLALLAGATHLYEWLHPEAVAADPLLQKKSAYLNMTFFVIRIVAFFALWWFLSTKIVGNSLKQDKTGETKFTTKNIPLSIAFIMIFAISYSLFSVDLLMSLHPHWFSTMFGVYCFSGLFQSTIAALIIFIVWFMKQGLLKDFVNENHLHDMGKLLFAFTVFYAYIAFCRFMLIWYANLPEETVYFLHRAHGGWMEVSLSLLVFKFIVPFLILLPRGSKRDPNRLVVVSILLLIMQYVDIYWMVYPNFNDGHPVFSAIEVGTFLGFLGLFTLVVAQFLSKNSIVAIKDPRLEEALHHHI